MTLSGFRAAPRKGHLDRVKRIFGYLSKMRNAVIRVRTEEPDFSGLPNVEYDWSRTVYGAIEEIIPDDTPLPLGNFVTLTHYVDANLMHDLITGRSVTGILHLLNKFPVDWYSKKQATVEVATYSSEMVAMRTCVEQIMDLHTTLRYLGVPIRKRVTFLGTMKQWLKPPHKSMPTFTNDTTCCPFISFMKRLLVGLSTSFTSKGLKILPTYLANIGDTPIFGLN
jgi:hypothetical protein